MTELDYKIETAYKNSMHCCADDEWRREEYKKYEQLSKLKESEQKEKIYLVFGQNYEIPNSRTVLKVFSSHDKAHNYYKECSNHIKAAPEKGASEDVFSEWFKKSPIKDSRNNALNFFFIGDHEIE